MKKTIRRYYAPKNEIITGINKEAWIPAIENKIAEWEEFARSSYCENDAEGKDEALRIVDELRDFMFSLKSDTVTRDSFDSIRLLMI